MYRLKSFFVWLLVLGMLLSHSASIKAGEPPPANIVTEDSNQIGGQTSPRNTVKPDYVATDAELARIALKDARAAQEAQKNNAGRSTTWILGENPISWNMAGTQRLGTSQLLWAGSNPGSFRCALTGCAST